jgi:hypothetical protein
LPCVLGIGVFCSFFGASYSSFGLPIDKLLIAKKKPYAYRINSCFLFSHVFGLSNDEIDPLPCRCVIHRAYGSRHTALHC